MRLIQGYRHRFGNPRRLGIKDELSGGSRALPPRFITRCYCHRIAAVSRAIQGQYAGHPCQFVRAVIGCRAGDRGTTGVCNGNGGAAFTQGEACTTRVSELCDDARGCAVDSVDIGDTADFAIYRHRSHMRHVNIKAEAIRHGTARYIPCNVLRCDTEGIYAEDLRRNERCCQLRCAFGRER